MSSVLVPKHVMENGKWVERPYVLTRTPKGWTDRPAEIVRGAVLTEDAAKFSVSKQLREAGAMLAIFALTFPIFFELAHWLRG